MRPSNYAGNRQLAIAFAALIGCMLSSFESALAQPQEVCTGPLIDPHDNQIYHFKTSSRIEPYPQPSSFHFMIVGCAENDTADWLTISWPVPVPRGFPNIDGDVPHNAKRDLPPMPIVSADVAQVGSCLRYGERGDTKRAMMLVPKEREQEFLKNDPGDCSRIVAMGSGGDVVPIENYAQEVTNYFPSYLAEAKSTMLRFSAHIGVRVEGDDRYRSYAQYVMEPDAGSKGDPTKIRFVPEFPSDTANVFVDFDKRYGKIIACLSG